MSETIAVDEWLASVLSDDTTLNGLVDGRIYGYQAPQGAAMPFVVWNLQGSHDVQGIGTARIMVDALYQVKAIGQTSSFADLKAIAARIDTVLQGANGVVDDGHVLSTIRQQPMQMVETDSGIEYRHLGGIYRIWVQ